MKLKELAEKHSLDVTELSCAISVAVGKELGPDDEIELTDEVVSAIKDFLGIDVALDGDESGRVEKSEKNKKVSKEGKQAETSEDKTPEDIGGIKEESEEDINMSSGEGQREEDEGLKGESKQVDSSQKEEKSTGDDAADIERNDKVSKEKIFQSDDLDKRQDAGEKDREDAIEEGEEVKEAKSELSAGKEEEKEDRNVSDKDKQEEELTDPPNIKEDEEKATLEEGEHKTESVQEAGTSHQEAYLQDRGDEEVAAQEAIPGGEESPEGVGDERRLLLGEDVPAASSAFQQKEEEKIPVDQISVREEGEKIEISSQAVPSDALTSEAISVDSSESSVRKKMDPMMIISIVLLGIAVLSFVVVVIGIMRVSSQKDNKKAKETHQEIVSYTDADFFALIYRMIEKGDLLAAKDMYEEMSIRFPESKFLDDLAMSLGDAFFSRAKNEGITDYFLDAQRFYRRAYELSQQAIAKQKALIKFCRCLKEMKRWKEAAQWFRRFVDEFPKSSYASEGLFFLAQSLNYIGEKKEAISVLKRLSDSEIRDDFVAKGILLLMKLLSQENEWEQVKRFAYLFLQRFPEHELFPDVLFLLGDALRNMGKLDEAEKIYIDATKKLGDRWLAMVLMRLAGIYEKEKKITDAISVYERIISEFKYNKLAPQAMFNEARLYYLMGNYKKALDLLFVLKERYYKWEDMPQAFWLISSSFAQEGNLSSSEKFLRKIIYKWNGYFPKWKVEWRLARILELEGKYISAVKFYDRMLGDIEIQDDEKRWFKVMLTRADDLMRSKQYEKAIGVFVRLLSNLRQRSKGSAKQGENKVESVSLGKNFKVSEDMLLYRLSVAYFYAGQYPKAIDSFRDLIGSYPLSPWRFKARFMLGRTYQKTGQLQLAIDQYTKVAINRFLADNELKSRSWEELGKIYLKLGRSDESYDALVKARELTRRWERAVELLLLQADALVEKRKFGSAIKLYGSYLDKMLKRYKAKIVEKDGEFCLEMGIDDPVGFEKITTSLIRIADTTYRMKNYKGALKVYSKVQSIFKEQKKDIPGWVLFQIGMCYKSMGQQTMANLFFDKVIKAYPDSMWAKEARWQKEQENILTQINGVKQVLEVVKQ